MTAKMKKAKLVALHAAWYGLRTSAFVSDSLTFTGKALVLSGMIFTAANFGFDVWTGKIVLYWPHFACH